MAGEVVFLPSRFGGMVSPLPLLWRSCGWTVFEAVMPFPYKHKICCLLDVSFVDLLTDLWWFYFATRPSVSDTCAATALDDYLYAVACERAVPKAKSHISWKIGDVQGKKWGVQRVFVWLLGLKKWQSVLGNKDNLHLISLGCSAGDSGRCSCVALKPCMTRTERPPLFWAGAAGALQPGLKLCVSEHGHRKEVWRQSNWLLVKPTPSLLSRRGVHQPWDVLKGKQHHPPVAALWGWGQCLSMLVFTDKGRRGWLQLLPENYGQGSFRSKPGHAQAAFCSCSYLGSTQGIE